MKDSYWRRPAHADADPDKIAERMEDRAYHNEFRDELHLARGIGSVRLKQLRWNSTVRERAFAKAWVKERGALRGLLAPYPTTGGIHFTSNNPHRVTLREGVVAATVIQWLGSNCGFAFLEKVLGDCGYALVRKKDSRG